MIMSLLSQFVANHVVAALEAQLLAHAPDVQAAFLAELQAFSGQVNAWIEAKTSRSTSTGSTCCTIMYIKVFEARDSKRSYTFGHHVGMSGMKHGTLYIDNELHKSVPVEENELFNLIDHFFKAKTHEKIEAVD